MIDAIRLLATGRDIARRHSLINRIRIGLMRIVREERKCSEAQGFASALLAEVQREIEWNRERQELEQGLAEIYGEFLNGLARNCPDLTESERSILLLTHAGFSTKEIANILYITTRGVQTQRYRAGRKIKSARTRRD